MGWVLGIPNSLLQILNSKLYLHITLSLMIRRLQPNETKKFQLEGEIKLICLANGMKSTQGECPNRNRY